MSMAERGKEWKSRLTDEEWESISGARRGQESRTLNATQAMDYAVSHVFVRESAIPEKKLLETALIQSVGTASVNDIRRESLREGILLNASAGLRYVTTRNVLQEEVAVGALVGDRRGRE